MAARGYTLFDTAIGRCGLAWSERGIAGVQLPEASVAATRKRLARRFPDASETRPTREAKRALEAVSAHLRGEPSALDEIALDLEAIPEFEQRVYAAARAIPSGATLSYGEIAAKLGDKSRARAVGAALGRNPFAVVVPCHRVLAANGKPGGFSANGGPATKLRLLGIEGARREPQASLFEGERALGFDPRAAVAHLRAVDPPLARLIDAVGPCALERELKQTASVFGALAEAIINQQLTGKAAATIYGRVCALFPRARGGFGPEHVLRAPEAKLRGAGLSRAKAAALKDLARRAKAGEIPTLAEIHALDDATIVERLSAVRGIGRWTAEMLLIFRLGRPDVLPADDYGVRKGFARAFRKHELPTKKELERRGERWRPYRTAASWYLWRAAEGAKG
jgi:methylated-DNA-[protein]-cysteine S-methyltransferase